MANSPVLSQETPGIRAEGFKLRPSARMPRVSSMTCDKKEWFKEKNITDMGCERGAASFVEASEEQCDVRRMTPCTATFQDLKVRSCLQQKKWKVSPKVQEKDEYEDGCPKGNPQPVETPEQCFTAFQSSSDVKSFSLEDDKPLMRICLRHRSCAMWRRSRSPCDAGFPTVKQSFQDLQKISNWSSAPFGWLPKIFEINFC